MTESTANPNGSNVMSGNVVTVVPFVPKVVSSTPAEVNRTKPIPVPKGAAEQAEFLHSISSPMLNPMRVRPTCTYRQLAAPMSLCKLL